VKLMTMPSYTATITRRTNPFSAGGLCRGDTFPIRVGLRPCLARLERRASWAASFLGQDRAGLPCGHLRGSGQKRGCLGECGTRTGPRLSSDMTTNRLAEREDCFFIFFFDPKPETGSYVCACPFIVREPGASAAQRATCWPTKPRIA
jgi:hypothetical protein